MNQLGTANWWLPRWLDKFLPTLAVEDRRGRRLRRGRDRSTSPTRSRSKPDPLVAAADGAVPTWLGPAGPSPAPRVPTRPRHSSRLWGGERTSRSRPATTPRDCDRAGPAGRGRDPGVVAAALRSGRIRSLRSGIYVAQDADLSSLRGRRRLALTVGGPDAVLSRTAAAVWGLARGRQEIRSTSASRCGAPGVMSPASSSIGPPTATRPGTTRWPVSDVRRLLRELALTEPADGFRFPALAAVQRGLITPDVLADPAGVPQRALRIWAEVGAEARARAVSGGEATTGA